MESLHLEFLPFNMEIVPIMSVLNAIRRSRTKAIAIALALGCVLASENAVAGPESTDQIVLGQEEWTGSAITSGIVKKLLEKMGYNVKVTPIDATAIFTALQTGDVSFVTETWTSSTQPQVYAAVATGKVVVIGPTGLMGTDRYWFPDYVKDKCPGLPDWKALNGCAKLFATPETGEKGRLLLYPEDWGGDDDTRIKTLGLNYQIVRAGSEAALLAQVKSAYQRKQPILAWLYSPHWAPLRYKGEFINLPPYSDDCPTKGFGCEKKSSPIEKLAWIDAEKKWPKAYALIKAFAMTNDEYGTLTGKVDMDGKSVDSVIDGWIADNKDQWSKWTQ